MNLNLNLMQPTKKKNGLPTPPQPTPGVFNIVYNGVPVVKGTDKIVKTN